MFMRVVLRLVAVFLFLLGAGSLLFIPPFLNTPSLGMRVAVLDLLTAITGMGLGALCWAAANAIGGLVTVAEHLAALRPITKQPAIDARNLTGNHG